MVTYIGRGLFLWGQPHLPSQGSRVPCVHPLTHKDQIWHRNTYGRDVYLGKPCDCVCTNTSDSFSASAEFLISICLGHISSDFDEIWFTYAKKQIRMKQMSPDMKLIIDANMNVKLFSWTFAFLKASDLMGGLVLVQASFTDPFWTWQWNNYEDCSTFVEFIEK